MSKEENLVVEISSNQFPVVGIGASAGGLKAITQFLKAVPAHSGIAYVFVQHLSPDHESLLPDILQKVSKIPVHQITDDIHLQPNHFYVIPSNKLLTATDGVLKLSVLKDKQHKIKVIDRFFSSLAVVHQSYAIGVVLSGTLNDGTVGLEVIKAYGGITFAQDEHTADFDGMPSSAINSGIVDFVLSPEKIAAQLLLINQPFYQGIQKETAGGSVLEDEEIFKQLLTVLRVRRGLDFSYYKSNTLKRRIIRRMALNAINTPLIYLNFLRENKAEQDALYNDMLISVTNFFRDPASFEILSSVLFPLLIQQKSTDTGLRIWIAGCATGEEAYSMAICLQEFLGDKAAAMKIQIFATDVSEIAIEKARVGIYRPMDLDGLSVSRLQQFFNKIDGNYQVNKIIRDMCVFAHHNFLKDPPFSKLDLVSCRNVLIYLEPVLQKKALNTFHYALNDHGFLMLGKSESIGKNTDLFAVYNHSSKIFQRSHIRGRFMQVTSAGVEQSFKDLNKSIRKGGSGQDIFKLADAVVLSKFAPAGVLINENFDIIQFRGKTDKWLTPAPGKASLNILRMICEDLAFELRNLLHLAKRNHKSTGKKNIFFIKNDQQQYVDIEITPIISAEDLNFLVLFQNSATVLQEIAGQPKSKKLEQDHKDLKISLLEVELRQIRADMRSITEEQDAVNEELQSANEELLSGSEELQSLNEELETSKEELQSTNEEITIINNELVDRNEQLNNARIYTEAIINTIRDPLIILDKDLKVKRATDGFYNKFKVTKKETEGKYFYELGDAHWDIPELRNLLENILPEHKVLSDFEVTHVFPRIGYRVMSLNTRLLDDLILLAIEDITDKRKVEQGLAEVELLFKESKERLKLAVDAAGLGTWDYNPLKEELIWDSRCKELFGLKITAKINYAKFIDMIHPDDKKAVDENLKAALSGLNHGEYEKEFRITEQKRKTSRWMKFKGKAYFNEMGLAYRFVGTALDITAQKIHDEVTHELLKQKDDFISIASHELKTPLTSLKASLQLITRLKDSNTPEKLNSLIVLSTKSLDKVSLLVEDLLNVSRLNHGQLHIRKTWFNVVDLINDCCQYVRTEGIYNITTQGDLKLQIFADAERISQVIVNFVNNAIKYGAGHKEIKINIEKVDQSIKVSVTDKGQGIPAEKLPHLFDRYYQVNTGTGLYSGLGLGLYICAEIIKKHNGQIGVDSEEGTGSTFWFKLPL